MIWLTLPTICSLTEVFRSDRYWSVARNLLASDCAALIICWRAAGSAGVLATPCTLVKKLCISGAMPEVLSASSWSMRLTCTPLVASAADCDCAVASCAVR
ncbi:hypothetical protein D9M68_553450 [compost metagenome]